LFEQALALWRGTLLPELDTPWVVGLRVTLEKHRWAAELDHMDAALRRGRHADLVPALSDRAQQHPWDERVAGQLMLALYRTGRQADALDHYQQLRTRLVDELGTDPGPPLQQLHQQILTAHPALTGPVGTATASPSPRQLPAAPRLFTGRTVELATLTAALDAEAAEAGATVVISALAGMGGIGKTWLALHWAHQNLHRFPDGQLFVDLRGFSPIGQPLSAQAATRGFLDALGVPPAQIPADPHAQTARYRDLVAGRRMLIVLDNAGEFDQVSPLLPGSPTCTVLVTGRRRLAGLIALHGAHLLNLDNLPEPDAYDMLARHMGTERLTAEPAAVADLLSVCAGLPLAVRIVATRAAHHPTFPLAVLAEELRDVSTRLDGLDAGDSRVSLRAVLSWSVRVLSPGAVSLFGLLGIAPGPDIGLPAAVCLAGLPEGPVRAVLGELENACLVQQHTPGRYRMHDLIRRYATDIAFHDLAEQARAEALRRVLDFYTHTAHTADRLLDPHRLPIQLDPPVSGLHPQPLGDDQAALAWLERERQVLLAAQHIAALRGWYAAWPGEYARTLRHDAYPPDGQRHDAESTLDSLGYIAHHTGDQQAMGYYRQALTLGRAFGNTSETP